MPDDIQSGKLLYHLTSLENVPSIFERGLLPRSQLAGFHDVADQEIIKGRGTHGLENYVPFHWFARNPFDGRVQRDHPQKQFVLITVHRSLAERDNWKVIPCHPLAGTEFRILDYRAGLAAIDWQTMNRRDYLNQDCKNVCMAECLSPHAVSSALFFKIFVPSEEVAAAVNASGGNKVSAEVKVMRAMFS
ncbi:DarT ssDNA thymidine ADP-ribosyltransferase family protein [Pseudomonas sp. NPDC089401]|uniref:DarT ssDNA thymidine ADP-ribosyltransferase family protein n=1 Tax=Pseudomonas sp. NPDC089401 TaxID=3364462 RepID=UPI0037F5CFD7